MTISGQALLAARLRARMSHRELAGKLGGIHVSNIHLWEHGIRAIPPARITGLEDLLGDLEDKSVARVCACCGDEYVSPYALSRFCSDECGRAGAAGGADRSPVRWNGKTQYSITPLLKRWRIFCVCCGTDEWLRMTDAQAHAQRPLRACARCGGMRWLEEDVVSRVDAVELVVGGAA